MKPMPKGRSVCGADALRFSEEPVGAFRLVDAAEGAEGAGLGDGGCEGASAVHGHGGGHEGVVEAEHLGEAGVDGQTYKPTNLQT